MPKKIDLTGKKFGKLTVIGCGNTIPKKTFWKCVCDCGNEKIVRTDSLRDGKTKSCGCINSPDITGKTFNRLKVIEKAYSKKLKYGYKIYWRCLCECGKISVVSGSNLKNGNTKSCGCYKIEAIKNAQIKHGLTKTPEHYVWLSMKRRCYDKSDKSFNNYGNRGIKVCDHWLESFESFLADMGPRPSKYHSIDRIDNNGDYEPKNCRWATKQQQNSNKRNNIIIQIDGIKKTIAQWQIDFKINRATFNSRVKKGMTIHKALMTPIKHHRKK